MRWGFLDKSPLFSLRFSSHETYRDLFLKPTTLCGPLLTDARRRWCILSLTAQEHTTVWPISMLQPSQKQKLIQKFKTHATDTGSPQIQIGLLSAEVQELIKHLQTHKKDHSSRRGLIKKVGERRRLMKYLKREDAKAYDDLMTKLNP